MKKRMLRWMAAALVLIVSVPAAASSFGPWGGGFASGGNLWLTWVRNAEPASKEPANKETANKPAPAPGKASTGSGAPESGAAVRCECPLPTAPER